MCIRARRPVGRCRTQEPSEKGMRVQMSRREREGWSREMRRASSMVDLKGGGDGGKELLAHPAGQGVSA